jgi:CubicO group peptidase (beta-lactamase class C family)
MIDAAVQEKIDALFASFDAPGSPGCALGIMRNGTLQYQRGYGLANVEHHITITPSTTFFVASMAKQFTGLAVALLADQGRLDLDADIRSVLPYVPDFGHRITAKHLLYHTSGLRSDIFLLMVAGWKIEDVIRQEDILEFVEHQRELDFVPGSEFSYCGTGYSLLAEMVAKISGQSFPQFCADHIFGPLGMGSTRFESDPLALIPGRAATYFATPGSEFRNAVLTIGILGGSGLYTTIEDLARWDENFTSQKVGGPSALQRMQTPGALDSGRPLPYAFGLSTDIHRGRRVLSHGGDSVGVHCYMVRFPEERLSVIVLGNSGSVRASSLAYAVADLLLDAAGNESSAPTKPCDALDVPEETLRRKSGRYFNPTSCAFIEIPMEDGRLHIYGHELAAASEDAFYVTAFPEVTVSFTTSQDGTQVATVDIGEGPVIYHRVDLVHPDPEELTAYEGTYHSQELDIDWRITLSAQGLVVHHPRQGTSVLSPMCHDVFMDPWVGELLHGRAQWVIAFDRERNRVQGLRVSAAGGRGRNLRFDKIR